MTRDEVAEIVHGMPQGMDADDYLVELVNRALAKREWVGLTDEEMRSLKQKSIDDGMTRIVSDFEYIRAIEAKLKEKNA